MMYGSRYIAGYRAKASGRVRQQVSWRVFSSGTLYTCTYDICACPNHTDERPSMLNALKVCAANIYVLKRVLRRQLDRSFS